MNVRIAPIPDKISTVGVEVPNKIVSIVYLRDIIDSPTFKNAQSSLTFAIGKDISGECVVGNIAKLPHMLIAGTTGSGKTRLPELAAAEPALQSHARAGAAHNDRPQDGRTRHL